jgi:cytochrome c
MRLCYVGLETLATVIECEIRAAPTLAGLFGRRIATLPGYNFSPALKKLDIV